MRRLRYFAWFRRLFFSMVLAVTNLWGLEVSAQATSSSDNSENRPEVTVDFSVLDDLKANKPTVQKAPSVTPKSGLVIPLNPNARKSVTDSPQVQPQKAPRPRAVKIPVKKPEKAKSASSKKTVARTFKPRKLPIMKPLWLTKQIAAAPLRTTEKTQLNIAPPPKINRSLAPPKKPATAAKIGESTNRPKTSQPSSEQTATELQLAAVPPLPDITKNMGKDVAKIPQLKLTQKPKQKPKQTLLSPSVTDVPDQAIVARLIPNKESPPAKNTPPPVSITFAENASNLENETLAKLDEVAHLLQTNQTQRIQLKGYAPRADKTISETRKLSLYRSMEIRKYLQSKGIDRLRMDIRALGDTDKSGAMLNRVDIVFTQ